ncbi:MAG: hypothetical protein Q9188_005343 [Gyalolechia gomerana]
MDSMRSLNTSLPRSPKPTTTQPPGQLLQAFKAAALSVTNLYKTAASNETRARQAGYQDALGDILSFLDKEKLGLGDGEGWMVRRWATERLDGSTTGVAGSESDDERGDAEKRARSSSPVVQDKLNHDTLRPRQSTGSSSPARVTSAPPMPTPPTSGPIPAPEVFSFRSSHAYPQDMDIAPSDSSANSVSQHEIQNISMPTPAAVRVDVLPRGSKAPHRNSGHPIRHNTHTATSLGKRSLGSGAGSKRRFDFTDYFGLGDLGDGRDGTGGGAGKRGRLS